MPKKQEAIMTMIMIMNVVMAMNMHMITEATITMM